MSRSLRIILLGLTLFVLPGLAAAGGPEHLADWAKDHLAKTYACGQRLEPFAMPKDWQERFSRALAQPHRNEAEELALEMARLELNILCLNQRHRDSTLAAMIGILPEIPFFYSGPDANLARHINTNRKWIFLQLKTTFHGDCEPDLTLRLIQQSTGLLTAVEWRKAMLVEIEALSEHLARTQDFVCEQVLNKISVKKEP